MQSPSNTHFTHIKVAIVPLRGTLFTASRGCKASPSIKLRMEVKFGETTLAPILENYRTVAEPTGIFFFDFT